MSDQDKRLGGFMRRSTLGASLLTAGLALLRLVVEGWAPVGAVLALTSMVFALLSLLLRRPSGLALARWGLPGTGLVGITAMALAEGGLDSEALFWLPSIPLIAAISSGQAGVVTFTALSSVSVGIIAAGQGDWGLAVLFKMMGLGGAVGFGGLVGLAYESGRREEQERLHEMLLASEAGSRAKSSFLASMSHELRTPLNAIVGFSKLLGKGKRASQTASESYEQRIERNAKHLLELINDVLDVSKIEAGHVQVSLSEVDLCEMVHTSVRDVESLSRGRSLKVQALGTPAGCVVNADARRLKQIVVNLLSNAIKFTPPGGQIWVRVIADEQGRAQRFDVIDTGRGIARDQIDRVFELFEQVEQGASRRHEGTGLGLALTRRLCELMDFRVNLLSELGVGSTFSVYFTQSAPILKTYRGSLPSSSASSSAGSSESALERPATA